MRPSLHLELTAHGFGHLAQTAPVLNALRDRLPALRLSVRSALPRPVLAAHLHGDFLHVAEAGDVGMLMDSAVDVRVADSAAAYRALYAGRRHDTAALVDLYRRLRPDLVLVNAPCTPLGACRAAGIPVMALCSLDWATVLESYCGDLPGMSAVLDWMRECYAGARPFLRPQPARPDIPFLDARAVGPIARLGRDQRRSLDGPMSSADTRLVLVALGGIDTVLPLSTWPRLEGVVFVTPGAPPPDREDWFGLATPARTFIDVLASADAVVTKPGYGTFVESVCNATRVLYSPRPDWPEEPWLSDWLERHGTARAVDRERLWHGDFADELEALLQRPVSPPLAPSGIADAVEMLATRWI